jgi:CRP-like cAMP-binding protein
VNKKTEILKQTHLFRDLSDDVLDLLASRIVEKKLDRNGILFVAEEPAAGLYVIAEGSVRAFRSGADGREQVIHVERAVTTIAEVPVFDEGAYPSTVAAEEPTRVFFIAKEDIRAISTKHPQLALAAAKLLAGRLRKCAELVESLSLREVGQRIAKLILEEAESRGSAEGSSVTFIQKLTHNQLAARIGTVREVVTRSILRMQAAGLIDVQGKTINVPDIDALRRYVD